MVMRQARIDRKAGYRLLAEPAGPAGPATIEGTPTGLDALAPGFPDRIVTAPFGGACQREGLGCVRAVAPSARRVGQTESGVRDRKAVGAPPSAGRGSVPGPACQTRPRGHTPALRDRQIATLAALTALGGVEPQWDDHVRNSLRIGVEPREIVEVTVHLAPCVGVPKAPAGLRAAAAVVQAAAGSRDAEDAVS